MNLRNRVQLIGNLGSDPKYVEFPNGMKMAKISVATSDYFRKSNIVVKETQWHTVVVWGNLAEIVRANMSKGYEIVVDGSLRQNRFTDKNGVEQHSYEVIADTILFNKPEKL